MPAAAKWIATIVSAVAAINFVTMPAEEYAGDAVAVRIETIGLINSGRLAVPPDVAHEWGERGQYFYENRNGAFYPKYGILNTLIYLPPLVAQKAVTGNLSLYSDNTLSLNLFNVVLSCATAAYLALLLRRYTNSNVTMTIFVMASLYCTFWWNYLRAQTFEIYLTVFFLAFFYHFVAALNSEERAVRNRQFLIASIFLGLLCLSKTLFLILIPIAATFFLRQRRPIIERSGDELLFWWLPLLISVGVLLATNWYKFGSPFASGYTQWSQESHPFTLNVWPAFAGLILGKQGSVFLHFPILIFALIGWPAFFKNYRRDAELVLLLSTMMFLITSAFTNWKGSACYGPRYLLPVLPLASLAFVCFIDWIRDLARPVVRWSLRGILFAVLAYSFLLQLGVNSLPFFFWYDLLKIAEKNQDASKYLDAHFGVVDLDYALDELGWSSRFHDNFVVELNPEEFVRFEGLRMETKWNYYWNWGAPRLSKQSGR